MKLTPKHIETFCRWWARSIRKDVNSGTLFALAYSWKYGVVEEKQVLFAYIAYQRSGFIPECVKQYWHERVLKRLIIQGGFQ